MGERVLATSDCERCRPGLVSQPANSLSSLAYVAAGAAMLRRPDAPVVRADVGPDAEAASTDRSTAQALAWATIAVGVGSAAYHGPGGALSRYAHDAGLIAMLGFLAWSDAEVVTGRRARSGLAVVPLVAAVGAAPRRSSTAQALAGVAAMVGEGARLRAQSRAPDGSGRSMPRPRAAAIVALTAGLAAQVFGRTGGPWCRPDSLLQPHAVWHVLTAAALWSRSRPAAG